MPVLAASFICGLIFGFGLIISGMAQPTKVLNFLDLFGAWDPSLALVMASALSVGGVGYAFVRRRSSPLLAATVVWPSKTEIDARLIAGAILFGIGWGLLGLCPGPAVLDLATLSPKVIVFVIAMAAGIMLHNWWSVPAAIAPQAEPDAAEADG